jgi:hypothetical protein
LVRPLAIEIRYVLLKHSIQMVLAENEHMIEALAPQAANKALTKYPFGERRRDEG